MLSKRLVDWWHGNDQTGRLANKSTLSFEVQASPVCLQTFRIDHTHVVDSKNVLFYMKDGKIWHNALVNSSDPQP